MSGSVPRQSMKVMPFSPLRARSSEAASAIGRISSSIPTCLRLACMTWSMSRACGSSFTLTMVLRRTPFLARMPSDPGFQPA